jgi:hypothetical protein
MTLPHLLLLMGDREGGEGKGSEFMAILQQMEK